ncbi:MAG: hypothetical protein RIK87_24270, partial [Fuerstiella sp.]
MALPVPETAGGGQQPGGRSGFAGLAHSRLSATEYPGVSGRPIGDRSGVNRRRISESGRKIGDPNRESEDFQAGSRFGVEESVEYREHPRPAQCHQNRPSTGRTAAYSSRHLAATIALSVVS